jgi:hypothetical protein
MQVRKALIAGLAIVGMVMVGTANAAGPTKFIDGPGNEWSASVNGDVTAWATTPSKTSYVHAVKVKEGAAAASRISKRGTDAVVGNVEIGGPHGDVVLFFQGADKGKGQWDVKLWDLTGDALASLPSKVNTSKNEIYGGISGDYLLFTRGPARGGLTAVFLYRFSTDSLTKIAEAPSGGYVTADSIAGDFASYTVCPRSFACNVFRYRISTEATKRMPDHGRANYWSALLPDGTVYYVQGSPRYCGYRTKLMLFTNDAHVLTQFPNGIEVGQMSATGDSIASDPTLYFTRIRCGHFLTGIWKI